MDDITVDYSLLTENERLKLDYLRKAVKNRDERALPNKTRGRGESSWGLVLVGAAIGGGAVGVAANQYSDSPEFWSLVRNGGIIALVLTGLALIANLSTIGWKRRAFERLLPDYVASLHLDRRAAAGRTGARTARSTGDVDKSRRQTQHEWYGDHAELNWHDRVRAEMYGIDADTYVSNVLENDKD